MAMLCSYVVAAAMVAASAREKLCNGSQAFQKIINVSAVPTVPAISF